MRILPSLEKPTEIHHNSGVSAACTNYDGFLWVFPRKVVRIRMDSRNSLYNAPESPYTMHPLKKSPNKTSRSQKWQVWDLLLGPQIPLKILCGSPFFAFVARERGILTLKILFGAEIGGLGWGHKVYMFMYSFCI